MLPRTWTQLTLEATSGLSRGLPPASESHIFSGSAALLQILPERPFRCEPAIRTVATHN